LADPEQILGLSRFSRDGWQSQAGDISRYPVLSGGAEDVLLIRPDIVVASAFDKRSTRELLKAKGFVLPNSRCREPSTGAAADPAKPATSPDIRIARRRKSRGSMRRWRAPAARSRRRHYRVLPLSRRGWVAGSDSFIGSLLGETGLRSAAGDLGFAFGGICLARSDREPAAGLHRGFAGRRHCERRRPGVSAASGAGAFLSAGERIVIPERMTECGGVLLADALDALTAEVKRVGR